MNIKSFGLNHTPDLYSWRSRTKIKLGSNNSYLLEKNNIGKNKWILSYASPHGEKVLIGDQSGLIRIGGPPTIRIGTFEMHMNIHLI